jgi:hypothetical protein
MLLRIGSLEAQKEQWNATVSELSSDKEKLELRLLQSEEKLKAADEVFSNALTPPPKKKT